MGDRRHRYLGEGGNPSALCATSSLDKFSLTAHHCIHLVTFWYTAHPRRHPTMLVTIA